MKKITIKKKLIASISSLMLMGAISSQANAQNITQVTKIPSNLAELSEFKGSVIDKIKSKNKIVIGYRESSIPMSYLLDPQKPPVGYGVDVCNLIVERFKQAYNLPTLSIEYQFVDGASRVPLVKNGVVDMECGSTSNTAARRKDVDFSITYMVAGARILARTDDTIQTLNDLKNRTVVFAKGTSQEALLKRLNDERKMGIKIVEAPNFAEAADSVYSGKADAFILDDNLLYGERSKVKEPEKLKVVGDFLALETLAIMLNKSDKTFKEFVDRQLVDMIQSGFLQKTHKKWFETPIPPNNKSLDLPASNMFKEVLRMPTDLTGS